MTALSTLRDRLTGPGMGALGALAAAAVALGTGTGVLQWQAHTHAREDAARAESLSGRLRNTQSSMTRCCPDETASAPGGTSSRSTVPAPV